MTFVEPGGETTLSALGHMLNAIQPGALIVALVLVLPGGIGGIVARLTRRAA